MEEFVVIYCIDDECYEINDPDYCMETDRISNTILTCEEQ